jgi:hypothetical protein
MVEFTVEEEETTSGSGEVIFHDKMCWWFLPQVFISAAFLCKNVSQVSHSVASAIIVGRWWSNNSKGGRWRNHFFTSRRVRIDMVQDDFYLFVSLLALGLFEVCFKWILCCCPCDVRFGCTTCSITNFWGKKLIWNLSSNCRFELLADCKIAVLSIHDTRQFLIEC